MSHSPVFLHCNHATYGSFIMIRIVINGISLINDLIPVNTSSVPSIELVHCQITFSPSLFVMRQVSTFVHPIVILAGAYVS